MFSLKWQLDFVFSLFLLQQYALKRLSVYSMLLTLWIKAWSYKWICFWNVNKSTDISIKYSFYYVCNGSLIGFLKLCGSVFQTEVQHSSPIFHIFQQSKLKTTYLLMGVCLFIYYIYLEWMDKGTNPLATPYVSH